LFLKGEYNMNTLGKKILTTVLINLLFIAANTFSLEAADLNHMLQGDYKLAVTMSCVISRNGFNADLTRIGNGSSFNSHVNGILTFDGNGNGTYNGSVLSINHANAGDGMAPVTPGDFSGAFTYTVNTDGNYNDNKVLTVTNTGGPDEGLIRILNGISVDGQLSSNGEILLVHDSKPNIEVITLPDQSEVDRICGSTGTAIKIKGVQPKVVVIPLM
jgi:hypothetical protein